MEAHVVLSNALFRVASYGTGTQVRLPGRTAMEPRIFKFGTPYADMYAQLSATPADAAYFTKNGVLSLCQRGAAVKVSPTRWQDCPTIHQHDVVIAFEERIYDAVIEDLLVQREPTENFAPLHVICLDTKDNPTEAAVSGQVCLDLCWRLEQCTDLTTEAATVIEEFQQERAKITPIKILYQVCYI
jgi:RNA polymerase II subunit A C-terminal domain phosphatase SSU72